jgi:hypothetical protein
MNIELLKPHRHAGRDYQSGDALSLDDDLANWLISLGVAKRTSTKSESKPDNTVVSIRQENHP